MIMVSRGNKNKITEKGSFKGFKTLFNCKVSKASNEIMLHRFYNGKGIQFPFAP